MSYANQVCRLTQAMFSVTRNLDDQHQPYCDKLDTIEEFLSRDNVNCEEVVASLGELIFVHYYGFAHTHVHANTHTQTCVHSNTHGHTHTHKHACTQKRMNTHTRTLSLFNLKSECSCIVCACACVRVSERVSS
jgi:hypothetical protein